MIIFQYNIVWRHLGTLLTFFLFFFFNILFLIGNCISVNTVVKQIYIIYEIHITKKKSIDCINIPYLIVSINR